MKRFLLALSVLVVLFTVFVFWASYGVQSIGEFNGEIRNQEYTHGQVPDTLTIATWNIAFAQGSGSDGSSYEPRSRTEMETRLNTMAQLLVDHRVDIALLQEVDFDADRSYRIDQLKFLAERSGLSNAAYAPTWIANYVAYPGLNPRKHWKSMNSGAGIISRFPISENKVELMKKPASRSIFYRLFYPFRYRQFVLLGNNESDLSLTNLHLEAFDSENRQVQAKQVQRFLSKYGPDLFGGDFNSIPPDSKKRNRYVDEPEISFENDTTMNGFFGLADYREAADSSASSSEWLTFPAGNPSRRLDYLFIGDDWEVLDAWVLKTGELSDHLPVFARICRKRDS